MVHYQAAFKLSPSDARALERARAIYREMGNLEMVATLARARAQGHAPTERARQSRGQARHGAARSRQARRRRCRTSRRRRRRGPTTASFATRWRRRTTISEDWLGEAERLQKQAEKSDSAAAARIMLRVARIYRLEVLTDRRLRRRAAEGRGRTSRSTSRRTSCSKARSARRSASTTSSSCTRSAPSPCADEREQAELYRRFASMWALRWNDVDRSAHFYRKALQAYYGDGVAQGAQFPGHLAAFGFLREIDGAKGEWAQAPRHRRPRHARRALRGRAGDPGHAGGVISWKEMKDRRRRKRLLRAACRSINPESEELHAFMRDTETARQAVGAAEGQRADGGARRRGGNGATAQAAGRSAEAAARRWQATASRRKRRRPKSGSAPAEGNGRRTQRAKSNEPKRRSRAKKRRKDRRRRRRRPRRAGAEERARSRRRNRRRAEAADDEGRGDARPRAGVARREDSRRRAGRDGRGAQGEAAGPDKGIEAWRKIVQANPTLRAPRRELQRVYHKAERWNALIELIKEEVEKLPDTTRRREGRAACTRWSTSTRRGSSST